MLDFVRRYWRRLAALVCALILAAGVGGLLFAWSGLYNVAASEGHWWIIDEFLRFGMRSSVRTHAAFIDAPPLDNAGMVRLGASHFDGGCAPCHGSPAAPGSPIADHMLPAPPDLSPLIPHWEPGELFWIVKHGFKYTGMPGWVAIERDDEVWAVVAFLKQLPDLSAEKYRELVMGRSPATELSPRELAIQGPPSMALAACGNCHGLDGRPPLSDLVPRLSGQTAEYLYRELKAYARGLRPSGFMQPVVAELDDDQMRSLARFYAGIAPRPKSDAARPADPREIELGRRIVAEGIPDQGVPACWLCHNATADPLFPRLAGQHGAFIARQLLLWKAGDRGGGELSRIMAPIARRLNHEQIAAVAAYFASLPPEPLASP